MTNTPVLTPTVSPDLRIGRHVRLRPVAQSDYAFLYDVAVGSSSAPQWRFRGATPSPESFVAGLWLGTLAQFIIERRADRVPMGLVAAYDVDFRNGFAYLGVLIAPQFQGDRWMAEGGILFMNYIFQTWGFRKIYAESTSASFAGFASGTDFFFRVEAHLKNHEVTGAGPVDSYILAFHRDQWDENISPIVARLLEHATQAP